MVNIAVKDIVMLASAGVLSAGALVGYFVLAAKCKAAPDDKKKKRAKNLFFFLLIAAAWFFCGTVFNILVGGSKGIVLEFSMLSERVTLFGVSFAQTSVIMWGVTAVFLILAVLFRVFAVPKFRGDSPGRLQNVMELAVEFFDNHTKTNVHGRTGNLSSYLFALSLLMFGCACAELFGLRAPTSDITVTFAMSLITFFLINWYGIKNKRLSGRIKGLASPSPVIFPMRIVSDVAVPVSLACRLFGNMLGGLIVMDLLKGAAGGYSFGIAPVAGLYFNLFHPLIQIYIFVTLSLTFINEACE